MWSRVPGELGSAWQGVPGTAPPSPPSGTATRRAAGSGERPAGRQAGKGTGPFPHTSPRHSFPPSHSEKKEEKRRKALEFAHKRERCNRKGMAKQGEVAGGIKGALLPRSLLFLLLLHSGTEFKWIFYSSAQLNRGSMPESCRAASADMLWARYYNFHNALLCSSSLLR